MAYLYRVDPTNIPPHLSDPQLEFFILFAILVAGKNAKQTYKKLNDFLERNSSSDEFEGELFPTPFEIVRFLHIEGTLGAELEASKFGQYKRIHEALRRIIDIDTQHLSVSMLESVPGIGPKTARFIMLYSDPSFNGVPLDTHILKFLNAEGWYAPISTPPAGKLYSTLESLFQEIAAKRGKTVRELDTEVWKAYNSKQQSTLKVS